MTAPPPFTAPRRSAWVAGPVVQAGVTALLAGLHAADRPLVAAVFFVLGAQLAAEWAGRWAGYAATVVGTAALAAVFVMAGPAADHTVVAQLVGLCGMALAGTFVSQTPYARAASAPAEDVPTFGRPLSELRRTKRALDTTESRMRAVYAKAAVAIEPVAPGGRLIDVSDRLVALLGYPKAALLDLTLLDLTDPDDRPREEEEVSLLLKSGTPSYTLEKRLICAGGRKLWVRTTTSIGQTATLSAFRHTVVEDISEQKRAELAQRESEAAYRAVFDLAGVGLALTDLDSGRLLRVNQRLCDLAGYTTAELLDAGLAALDDSDGGKPQELSGIRRLRLGEQVEYSGEQSLRRKDGTVIWVQVTSTAMRDAEGKPVKAVAMVRDITRERASESALRASEARYRLIAENATDFIGQLDRDLRVTYASPACRAVVGRDPAAVVNKPFADLCHPADRDATARTLLALARDGGTATVHYRGLPADGGERWLETSARAVLGPDGRLRKIVAVTRDIAARRRLEAELRQVQKMEAVGQLAGGIAHDFNNLLNVIIGNLTLMRLPAGDPQALLRDETVQAADRAAVLTGQLLGYARKTDLELRPVELGGLIDQTVAILRRTIDPRIQIVVSERAAVAEGDAGQLSQVLMNLCVNARDAMPQGGRLEIAARPVTVEPTGERAGGRYVRLRVADTGDGMDAETRARIFDPFFTTKPVGRGTGLGLAMVHGIVEQHRGWIECDSTPGRGTTFDLYLPHAQAVPLPVLHDPDAAVPAPEGPAHGRVLLVDDDAMIRKLGRHILADAGFDVALAEDGAIAIALVGADPSAYDVVVLDLTMPRLSGVETLRRLRGVAPGVRVLLSSGYSAEQVGPEDRRASVGFVKKPYRPAELVRSVRAAIAGERVA